MECPTLCWVGDARTGYARLLDQTRLPTETVFLEVRSATEMIRAIQVLAVRGAPALGVAGAYGFVLGLQPFAAAGGREFLARARQVATEVAGARPTAVNLPSAVQHSLAALEGAGPDRPGAALLELALETAAILEAKERAACERIGRFGAELFADGMGVLTHCNAGALCTVGLGTALAPLYTAARQGKRLRVFADETRPLFQGARLTAWELARAGIDVRVIVEGAAGLVLARGWAAAVIVGADRIAANGDVANKIGTYPLAVLARRHGVPFYVAAPLSTFDAHCPEGGAIPIEERAEQEVTHPLGRQAVPDGVRAFNPAFDVTPVELVSAFVTDRGVLQSPGSAGLGALLAP